MNASATLRMLLVVLPLGACGREDARVEAPRAVSPASASASVPAETSAAPTAPNAPAAPSSAPPPVTVQIAAPAASGGPGVVRAR